MKEYEEWLKRAKSSLEHGKRVSEEDLFDNGGFIFYEELCFDLQQSVEKALKALLIFLEVEFPKTHNLSQLLKLIEDNSEIVIPSYINRARRLNDYAVQTRYPDDYEKVTKENYEEALEIAEDVYSWVRDLLS